MFWEENLVGGCFFFKLWKFSKGEKFFPRFQRMPKVFLFWRESKSWRHEWQNDNLNFYFKDTFQTSATSSLKSEEPRWQKMMISHWTWYSSDCPSSRSSCRWSDRHSPNQTSQPPPSPHCKIVRREHFGFFLEWQFYICHGPSEILLFVINLVGKTMRASKNFGRLVIRARTTTGTTCRFQVGKVTGYGWVVGKVAGGSQLKLGVGWITYLAREAEDDWAAVRALWLWGRQTEQNLDFFSFEKLLFKGQLEKTWNLET